MSLQELGVSAPDAPANSVLEMLDRELDTILSKLPQPGLKAQGALREQLGFEVSPQEVKAVFDVAADPRSSGPRIELSRRLLAVHLLARRTLTPFAAGAALDGKELMDRARRMSQLDRAGEVVEAALSKVLAEGSALREQDRNYLAELAETLSCPHDELRGASRALECIHELMTDAQQFDLCARYASLGQGEKPAVLAMLQGTAAVGSRYTWLVAVAVRCVVDRNLRKWGELPAWSSSDVDARSAREALLLTLQVDRGALDHVMGSLQRQHDLARVAGSSKLANELHASRSALFGLKLKLVPILRDPYADPVPESSRNHVDERASQLLAASAQAEVATEQQRAERAARQQQEKDLYRDALKDTPLPAASAMPEDSQETERKSRRRVMLLSATAFVMAIASLVVNLTGPPAPPPPPAVPTAQEFSSDAGVTAVQGAGSVLFTEVTGWQELTPRDRLQEVERLGQQAQGRGFGVMFVTEGGISVAQWSSEQGPELIEPRFQPDDG